MFRLVQAGNSLPHSFPVDPSSEFQPGMIAQLNVIGNNIVCGVSDGTAPIGIIDEIKTKAFTAPSVDEEIIVTVYPPTPPHPPVASVDVKAELLNPNVVPSSFISNPCSVVLNPRNGVITFPAGTALNYDMAGSGTADSIRTVVSYTYQIPNIIGDDSTQGSGRVTVWFTRLIGQTTMYETSQPYAVGATLFCSESGLWTTRRATDDHPPIGIVTAPPGPVLGALEFLYL